VEEEKQDPPAESPGDLDLLRGRPLPGLLDQRERELAPTLHARAEVGGLRLREGKEEWCPPYLPGSGGCSAYLLIWHSIG
jgi:hypothetical protein